MLYSNTSRISDVIATAIGIPFSENVQVSKLFGVCTFTSRHISCARVSPLLGHEKIAYLVFYVEEGRDSLKSLLDFSAVASSRGK